MSRFRPIAVLALACVVAVSACSSNSTSSAGDASRRSVVIRQEAPVLVDIGVEEQGKSVGDLLYFEASVTDADGNRGTLIGSLATVRLTDANLAEIEERLANLVFRFGDDMLIVSGGSEYPSDQSEMQAGAPQLRAVVGGTGRFFAARGEVVTERMEDGTYTHTFSLVGAADS
jgi:hypothetical protein